MRGRLTRGTGLALAFAVAVAVAVAVVALTLALALAGASAACVPAQAKRSEPPDPGAKRSESKVERSEAKSESESKSKDAKDKKPADAADKCQRNEDCALVPDDCCPCTAGGKQHAIARKGVEAYQRARQQRCGGTMCAEMMSQDPSCASVAVCASGRCGLGPPPAKK